MISKPFGSFQDFINVFKQIVVPQLGIPQEIVNDPNKIIQHMMRTGRLSQSQYNNAWNKFQQIQNDPMFRQFMK